MTESNFKQIINDQLESYISKVGKNNSVFIKTSFRQDGYVKISRVSKEDIDKFNELETKSLEHEIAELKRMNKLRKHLDKLREIRNERKRIL